MKPPALAVQTRVCIHARTQLWKIPPFRGFWTEKHPFFNRNRWFWGLVKHFFEAKSDFCFITSDEVPVFMKAKYLYKAPDIFFVHILNVQIYSKPEENRQIRAKCLPFYKISRTCVWKWPRFFFILRIRATHRKVKIPPSSRKLLRAQIYALVRRGEPRWNLMWGFGPRKWICC